MNRSSRVRILVVFAAVVGFPIAAGAAEGGAVRLPWHLDSWTAVFVLGYAWFLASLLNHARADVRSVAGLLAGITLVTFAVSIGFLFRAGYLEEVQVIFFWHEWIPAMLAAASIVLGASGVFVLWLSMAGYGKSEDRSLVRENSGESFGAISRGLHWTVAILMIMLIPQGILSQSASLESVERYPMFVIHKSLGLTVLILAIARLFWFRHSPKPAHSAGLKTWELRLSQLGHFMLYFLMFAWPISGYVLSNWAGSSTHFYFVDVVAILPAFEDFRNVLPIAFFHSIILPALLVIFLGMHVLGALKHHFIDNHREAIRRMLG